MKKTNIEKVKELVFELMKDDDSGHSIDHINRVLELSLKISNNYKNVNKEVLSLIALLHDVDDYKLFGYENSSNLKNAKEIMEVCKVSLNIQNEVCAAIHNIGYKKRLKGLFPTTIEGKIVSDADMCDALGANGILRVYRYCIKNKKPFFDRKVFPMVQVEENSKCSDSSVNHMFEKILKLKNLMLTDEGKKEAEYRTDMIIIFLNHLFEEENANEWMIYLNNYLNNENYDIII